MKDLAGKLGIDTETLAGTIQNYNDYCQHGKDPEFHRHPGDLIGLNDPPYYAVKLWPGGSFTQGGPRRNSKAQLINIDGDPISGLYSVSELGPIFGFHDITAGNLAECFVFGRIAGENSVKEPY